MSAALLQVRNLRVEFPGLDGPVQAVNDVSVDVEPGEIIGLVGESGCGKTMLGLSIMRLVPEPGRIMAGEVQLSGRNLLTLSEAEMRRVRGSQIGMIFQDPSSSLNPVMTIGWQIREAINAHQNLSTVECRRQSLEMLRAVKIPDPEARMGDFPHQYSGGMRQRVMIAMGMANRPSLLIADEPTTALDVTVQAQIIELLRALNRETGTAIILITHNIALVSRVCARVVVMYAGQVVESGPTLDVFETPQHPYTAALLRAVPRIDPDASEGPIAIEGRPPSLAQKPAGCAFHPRCSFRHDICSRIEPPLIFTAATHQARCWLVAPADGSALLSSLQHTESGATRAPSAKHGNRSA